MPLRQSRDAELSRASAHLDEPAAARRNRDRTSRSSNGSAALMSRKRPVSLPAKLRERAACPSRYSW
jgi:hypothetical protein